jgi:hypothetical protein
VCFLQYITIRLIFIANPSQGVFSHGPAKTLRHFGRNAYTTWTILYHALFIIQVLLTKSFPVDLSEDFFPGLSSSAGICRLLQKDNLVENPGGDQMVDQYSTSCRHCGKSLDADATFCPRCGKNVSAAGNTNVSASPYIYNQSAASMPEVDNYLVWAILATIFCCLPFGVVAIVYAAQVNSALLAGNYELAVSNAEAARKWCWAAFWVGMIGVLLYVVTFAAGSCASVMY